MPQVEEVVNLDNLQGISARDAVLAVPRGVPASRPPELEPVVPELTWLIKSVPWVVDGGGGSRNDTSIAQLEGEPAPLPTTVYRRTLQIPSPKPFQVVLVVDPVPDALGLCAAVVPALVTAEGASLFVDAEATVVYGLRRLQRTVMVQGGAGQALSDGTAKLECRPAYPAPPLMVSAPPV
jgi:hypothetical protein